MEKDLRLAQGSAPLVIDPFCNSDRDRPLSRKQEVVRGYHKNSWIAAGLSLVPGLGHFYIGRKRKGWALICLDAGIFMNIFLTSYLVLQALGLAAYILTISCAGFEAYFIAKKGKTPETPDTRGYSILMLLVAGFSALPLIWQSRRFSGGSKALLTLAAPFLTFLFFGSLILWSPRIEGTFSQIRF